MSVLLIIRDLFEFEKGKLASNWQNQGSKACAAVALYENCIV